MVVFLYLLYNKTINIAIPFGIFVNKKKEFSYKASIEPQGASPLRLDVLGILRYTIITD